MALTRQQKGAIIALMGAIIAIVQFFVLSDDWLAYERMYHAMGQYPAKDVYAAMRDSGYCAHHYNMNPRMFEFIIHEMLPLVAQPINVDFKYTYEENLERRWSSCKLDNLNRIGAFLHEMSEGTKVWTSAWQNGWNAPSISRNWRHNLFHFLDRFDGQWIRPMSATELVQNQVWPNYPTACCALDGSMFRRRMTTTLPDGVDRVDYFDHKHQRPEAINVQSICTSSGIATHLLTGVPGRMPDINAGRHLLHGNQSFGDRQILTDATYSHYDRRLVPSDDTVEHAAARSCVEFKFGSVKTNYQLVGGTYRRSSEWHSAAIRGAFILDNMRKVFGPNDEY